MKICEFSGSASGGVAHHLRQICGLLLSGGHRVVYAGPAGVIEDGCWPERPGGVSQIQIPLGPHPRLGDAAAVWKMRQVFFQTQVVHAHGLRAGAVAALAKPIFSASARLVVTLHNIPVGGWSTRAIGMVLLWLCARRADCILTVSPDLAERAEKYGAQAKLAIIAGPEQSVTDGLKRFEKPCDNTDSSCVRLLTVARLAPQKGLEELVEVVRKLSASRTIPRWQWHICGDGPLRDWLQDQIGNLESIRIHGHCSNVALKMSECDILVMTSRWEGQPVTLRQALAARLPAVVTDVGGNRSLCQDAVLYCTTDPADITEKLVSLMKSPQRRHELSILAGRRYLELPGAQEMMTQLLEIYRG